jgi:hypothetical protein
MIVISKKKKKILIKNKKRQFHCRASSVTCSRNEIDT